MNVTPPFARPLLVAWLAVAIGATLLALRYADMPSSIPVYRDASGHATVFGPKSVAIVFRIAAMGVGQVGATAVLWLHARAASNPGWTRFWAYAALAAAGKTLVECAQFATLGTQLARQPAVLWLGAALLPVLVFLALAMHLWRTRRLTNSAALRPRDMFWLCASLGIWLGFATFPAATALTFR